MNTPNPQQQFAFNAPPPPMPGNPNNFPPSMPTAPLQPVAVDWAAKAREQIRAKVFIDGKPITTPQMVEWAYAEISKRMGPGAELDKRMTEGLAPGAVGSVNLGNDNEEQLTPEQRQEEIIKLIPSKLTWQGAVCMGTREYLGQVLNWMWGNIPSVTSLADPAQKMIALHNWIRNIPGVYELDDATRAAKVQQAPPNPVSDQVTPQVAQMAQVAPVTPPAAADEVNNEPEEPMLDPTDGTKCKNLRGLKTRVTKTHKSDWGAFCTAHSLDPLTGRPNGNPKPVGGPIAPTTPPPPSSPLPALVGTGAPLGTPAVVPPPAAPSNTGIVHPVIPPTHNPPPLYVAPGQPSPEYLHAQQGNQAMPVPPAQQPTSPVQFTPTFIPPPAVPAASTVVPNNPSVPNMAIGFQPMVVPLPLVVQPQQPVAQQPTAGVAGMDRNAMAQMLGGPVNLIVVRLLEINSVSLAGGVDANQLALLAEKAARDELRIVDLAAAQYGAGKQAAQRHFAALLTKNPNCYLLMNGFEFIIPDGFLDILIARTVYVLHVSDRGGNVEIKF